MATYVDSLGLDFNEDFNLLESALRNENFKSMFYDTIKELGADKNLKHYESELKKLEKERGVDVSLIQPLPGIALISIHDSEIVFINIGHCDKIAEPLFDVVQNEDKPSLSWKVPHAVTKPKIETLKTVIAQLNDNLSNKKRQSIVTAKQDDFRIYDIIVNTLCFENVKQNQNFKRFLIETAVESLEKQFGFKLNNVEVLAENLYIGPQTPCLIKTVYDPLKHKQSTADDIAFPMSKLSISKHAAKRAKHGSTSDKHQRCSNNSNITVPEYKLVHINHITLQDFASTKSEEPHSRKPHSLGLEISLPGTESASEMDVEVLGRNFKLETKKKPLFHLELSLPYDVEEEPISAKFDVSTSKLRLELLVAATKGSASRLTSVSTDSGIECESGYRTSSDVDNSSVSSQEDCLEANKNESKTQSDPQKPSAKELKCLIPSYSVSETNINILIATASCNILAKSVSVLSLDERTIKISYTTLGGGLAPIGYGLYVYVEPNSLRKNGLHYKIRNNEVLFKLRKTVPGLWQTIKIGSALTSAQTVEMKNSVKTSQDYQILKTTPDDKETCEMHDTNPLSYDESSKDLEKETKKEASDITDEPKPRRPSDCFLTSSWPRGILKSRSRSLSESYLGCYDAFTSIELDDDDALPEEDEAFDNSYEKKSVRFSGVVSKQVFKANSSILGQKIKNQKKAMRRRKNLERRLSEGDNCNVTYSEESLADICDSSQPSSLTLLASNGGATTTTDGETTESDNRAPQSAAKARKRGAKGKNAAKSNKGQKGRKNRKDTARMNLSNEMIFQFDSI